MAARLAQDTLLTTVAMVKPYMQARISGKITYGIYSIYTHIYGLSHPYLHMRLFLTSSTRFRHHPVNYFKTIARKPEREFSRRISSCTAEASLVKSVIAGQLGLQGEGVQKFWSRQISRATSLTFVQPIISPMNLPETPEKASGYNPPVSPLRGSASSAAKVLRKMSAIEEPMTPSAFELEQYALCKDEMLRVSSFIN